MPTFRKLERSVSRYDLFTHGEGFPLDRRLWEYISCRGSNPGRLTCCLVAVLSYCHSDVHLYYGEIRGRNMIYHLWTVNSTTNLSDTVEMQTYCQTKFSNETNMKRINGRIFVLSFCRSRIRESEYTIAACDINRTRAYGHRSWDVSHPCSLHTARAAPCWLQDELTMLDYEDH
jgi:hypothetical protein